MKIRLETPNLVTIEKKYFGQFTGTPDYVCFLSQTLIRHEIFIFQHQVYLCLWQ